MKRWAAFLLLLGWLLPALACNLPRAPGPAVDQPVLETLAALQAATPPVEQPAPGETQPPVPAPAPTRGSLDIFPTLTPGAPAGSPSSLEGNTFRYFTQPGDTPQAVALRFGVEKDQIQALADFPPQAMLPTGLELGIPNQLGAIELHPALLPDSEVVYSHTTFGFSAEQYILSARGYLSTYSETVENEVLSGAQVVERAALETSINPRLLLAFLEYRSGWVLGSPSGADRNNHPIGFYAGDYRGLYKELILTSRQLTLGYYGWRSGKQVDLEFLGGERKRLNPLLNPGSAALQNLFAKLYKPDVWQAELYQPDRFMALYTAMFGDAWSRAAAGPVLPPGLAQPLLELPFLPGQTWTLTGGPHTAWGIGSAWGGIDFAPADVEPGCTVTRYWTTAAAAGLVTRSENGVVAVDLDGDGSEGTGWVLVYLHIAKAERVSAGAQVQVDDRIGHPSCEGGVATGTHVHLARKYNGEWISAGEPLPFVLSGWQAWEGSRPYSGSLTREGVVVTARPDGTRTSLISR